MDTRMLLIYKIEYIRGKWCIEVMLLDVMFSRKKRKENEPVSHSVIYSVSKCLNECKCWTLIVSKVWHVVATKYTNKKKSHKLDLCVPLPKPSQPPS